MKSGRGDGDGRGGPLAPYGARSGSRPPLAVLVVDPDAERAQLLAQWLQPLCLVAIAPTVHTAASIIGQRTPDLIVVDLDLPDMPGVEFIGRLAQMPMTRHILFMVVTYRGSVRDKIDALRAGADEYLVWPCTQEFFVQRVKLLSRFRRIL
ncbi:MAG TPA: response regulator [Ktedonobacterales bacterium]